MSKISDNHAKAPICARFINTLRELFGDVKVLYVKEGTVELGERSGWPTEEGE